MASNQKNRLAQYDQIDRWRRAARGSLYTFLSKDYNIINVDGYQQTLTTKFSQRRILDTVLNERQEGRSPRVAVLKSRRVGVSTAITGFNFWDCYTGENASGVVMTHLASVSEDQRNAMLNAYEQLPAVLQMPFQSKSKDAIGWTHNNSLIRFGSAENPNFAIGRTVRQFHGSEYSRWPNFHTILTDNLQAVPDSVYAWIILESTAKGTDHPSYPFWLACESGDEPYIPIFLRWWDDEDTIAPPWQSQRAQDEACAEMFEEFKEARDRMDYFLIGQDKMDPQEALRRIYWYYQKYRHLRKDLQKLQENFPMTAAEAFIASGNPWYPMDIVDKFRTVAWEGKLYDPTIRFTTSKPIRADGLRRDRDAYLEIWREPSPAGRYVIAADAATATANGDYSAAGVFDLDSGHIIAVLHGRIEIPMFADMLIDLSNLYNKCRVAPEAKGTGGTALMEMLKFKKFNRLWNRRKPSKLGRGWEVTNELGWDTNQQTRPIMTEQSKRLMREKFNGNEYKSFIPSAHILDQMRTFVNTDGKPEHKRGCHDDLVMMWNIGIMICLIESNNAIIPTGLNEVKRSTNNLVEGKPLSVKQTIKMITDSRWCGESYNDFYRGT